MLPSLGVLTVVSGIGDAISYLGLGHVFVANMTGNVVFLGFGAAGAAQPSVAASPLAGAAAGAVLVLHVGMPIALGAMLALAAGAAAPLLGSRTHVRPPARR